MSETESVVAILGLTKSIRTMSDLDSAVAKGLPKRSLDRLSARLHGPGKVAQAFRYEIVPLATLKRRSTRLSVAESERTERLARVLAKAEYVWDDSVQAREWMNKAHPELSGKSPLETSKSELGARRVEELLDNLFYGLPV